jgi:NADP-dependent 3-hydroxy acid dehydrogenase YdfG
VARPTSIKFILEEGDATVMKDPRTIVVVGANSAIARGVAALYADQEATFFLVARDEEKLRATVAPRSTSPICD